MTNMIRMVAVLCLTALLVAAFGGCSASGVSIDFGEKYTSGETFYVFESDGTGYREIHDSDEGMISVRETFLWRETSDGAVLLFSLDIEYLDDHTSAASFSSLIEKPISFIIHTAISMAHRESCISKKAPRFTKISKNNPE